MALRDLIFKIKANYDGSEVKEAKGDLQELGSAAKDSGGAFEEINDKIAEFSGPLALGGAALAVGAFVNHTLNAADEIHRLADVSGLSAEELQILSNVAATAGGDIEDVADASREMQLRLAEAAALGSGPAVDALNLLGISLEEIGRLNTADQFALLRDRISEVQDPAERLFVAEELLGGSTERLNALITTQTAEYEKLRTEIGEVGIFTNQQIEDLNRANDAWQAASQAISGTATTLVAEAAPAIENAAEGTSFLGDVIGNIISLMPGMQDAIENQYSGPLDEGTTITSTYVGTLDDLQRALGDVRAETNAAGQELDSYTTKIEATTRALRDQADAARLAAAQIRETKIQAGDLATTLDFYGDLYGISDVTGAGSVQRGNDLQSLTTGGTATEEETTRDDLDGYGGSVL